MLHWLPHTVLSLVMPPAAALLLYSSQYVGAWERAGAEPLLTCLQHDGYLEWILCWGVWMARLGLPLGQRSIGGVVYLDGGFSWPAIPAGSVGEDIGRVATLTGALPVIAGNAL